MVGVGLPGTPTKRESFGPIVRPMKPNKKPHVEDIETTKYCQVFFEDCAAPKSLI